MLSFLPGTSRLQVSTENVDKRGVFSDWLDQLLLHGSTTGVSNIPCAALPSMVCQIAILALLAPELSGGNRVNIGSLSPWQCLWA